MIRSLCHDRRDEYLQPAIPYWQRKYIITGLVIGTLALVSTITLACLNRYVIKVDVLSCLKDYPTTYTTLNYLLTIFSVISGLKSLLLFVPIALLTVDGINYLRREKREMVQITTDDYGIKLEGDDVKQVNAVYRAGDVTCFKSNNPTTVSSIYMQMLLQCYGIEHTARYNHDFNGKDINAVLKLFRLPAAQVYEKEIGNEDARSAFQEIRLCLRDHLQTKRTPVLLTWYQSKQIWRFIILGISLDRESTLLWIYDPQSGRLFKHTCNTEGVIIAVEDEGGTESEDDKLRSGPHWQNGIWEIVCPEDPLL